MAEDESDFVLNQGFGPMRVEHTEAGGFELARSPVELEGSVEFLFRRHAAEQLEVFGAVIFVQHGRRVREMGGKRELGVELSSEPKSLYPKRRRATALHRCATHDPRDCWSESKQGEAV